MANLKIETTVTTVDDVDTNDFPSDYTIEDILEEVRSQAKTLVTDAIDNELASVSNRVMEVAHGS